jgi:NADH:ubiquinone oxidoreductase subunit E
VVISRSARERIDAEIEKYPVRRGALLPALHIVHEECSHIDPETAVELAEIFGIRPVDVMEVVSFYNMFHSTPQARHHAYVCTNLSCSLQGACAYAPAMRVGDTYHEDLDLESAKRILDGLA